MNIFEFAIMMELDGEKYYTEQARLNKDSSLSNVLMMLAKDERSHAEVLQKKYYDTSFDIERFEWTSEAKNVFDTVGDMAHIYKAIPEQLDFYRMALEKEKQSIELYSKYCNEAENEETRQLFEYLVKLEKEHYDILDEIILQINKANEWVESAEFGIREEY